MLCRALVLVRLESLTYVIPHRFWTFALNSIIIRAPGKPPIRPEEPTMHDDANSLHDDAKSLMKSDFSRRAFVVTTLGGGFALAVQPVSAPAIETDDKGLIAGQ